MSPFQKLRLGTRGSQLALWQARAVADRIAENGGPPCEVITIKTSGDHLQDAPLSEIGGKRVFVKEIEDALLRHEIDLAVHSSKDLPAHLPQGLIIAGVLPREDPRDAVVLPFRTQSSGLGSDQALSPQPSALASIDDLVALLGHSPSIGTASVRRVAQLTRLFPGGRFSPIRGNLDTRLRKLDSGDHQALVLAAAGLHRLGFERRISFALPVDACVPAPGQGIVAIEIRENDEATRQVVERVNDGAAGAALAAERAVVETLGGGCQTPVGAVALPVAVDEIELVAVVVALDGSRAVRASLRGASVDAAAVGARVGSQLLAEGADEILADARRAHAPVGGIQP